ncbi:unnamed protein product [Arabidopsis halleri]
MIVRDRERFIMVLSSVKKKDMTVIAPSFALHFLCQFQTNVNASKGMCKE